MNRVDGVILGVGVVVLAASIIGVILYDDTGGSTFEVTFQESDATALETQNDGGEPGEYEFPANLTAEGLATSLFEVEASANGVRATADSVQVEVEGPDGFTGSCSFQMAAGPSGSGSCEAEIEVQEQPERFTTQAANATLAEDDGRERLSDEGSGEWIVTVTVQGGQTGPTGGASYTIDVTPSYTTWAPQAISPGPDGISGP